MKKSRFTEPQIIKALKENENGKSVEQLSRELGINPGTFYNWRKKYAGMDTSQLKELKALQTENSKLKRMYADLALENTMIKDVLSKKW